MYLSTLLDRARAEIGYTESPPGSNRTKYAVRPIEVGQPWCGTFVDAMFAGSGLLPGSMFYTPAGAQAFRAAGRWVPTTAPEGVRVGDVVFMTFRPDRVISHVGIVEEVLGAGYVQTIEGNTSFNFAGSQDNGGAVARRVRAGAVLVGFGVVDDYEKEDPMPPVPLIRKTSTGEIDVFGDSGRWHVAPLEVLTKLQAAGLVASHWVELDDETFDAIPLAGS